MFWRQKHTRSASLHPDRREDASATCAGRPRTPKTALTACRFQHPQDIATLTRHPCQQAADFLACTRPSGHCGRLILGRLRRPPRPGPHERHRTFVVTRSGADTMPTDLGEQPLGGTHPPAIGACAGGPRHPGGPHPLNHLSFYL
jgi:hypothetical protein